MWDLLLAAPILPDKQRSTLLLALVRERRQARLVEQLPGALSLVSMSWGRYVGPTTRSSMLGDVYARQMARSTLPFLSWCPGAGMEAGKQARGSRRLVMADTWEVMTMT